MSFDREFTELFGEMPSAAPSVERVPKRPRCVELSSDEDFSQSSTEILYSTKVENDERSSSSACSTCDHHYNDTCLKHHLKHHSSSCEDSLGSGPTVDDPDFHVWLKRKLDVRFGYSCERFAEADKMAMIYRAEEVVSRMVPFRSSTCKRIDSMSDHWEGTCKDYPCFSFFSRVACVNLEEMLPSCLDYVIDQFNPQNYVNWDNVIETICHMYGRFMEESFVLEMYPLLPSMYRRKSWCILYTHFAGLTYVAGIMFQLKAEFISTYISHTISKIRRFEERKDYSTRLLDDEYVKSDVYHQGWSGCFGATGARSFLGVFPCVSGEKSLVDWSSTSDKELLQEFQDIIQYAGQKDGDDMEI